MDGTPDFLWSDDDAVSEAELRRHLASSDDAERALWEGRVLREAPYRDVWRYLDIATIQRDWERITRHLGRRRAFWEFLLNSWRSHGWIG